MNFFETGNMQHPQFSELIAPKPQIRCHSIIINPDGLIIGNIQPINPGLHTAHPLHLLPTPLRKLPHQMILIKEPLQSPLQLQMLQSPQLLLGQLP